jgi:hypothetical protein
MNSSQPTHGATLTDTDQVTQEVPIDELVSQAYGSALPEVKSRMLAQLVGKVYETAPPTLQSRLLHQLIRPLGILSLLAIANGIFAKLWFRSTWPEMQVQLEDAQNIRTSDVILLVEHVQQVSMDAVDGLAHLLAVSPLMTSSAAAAVLVTLLMNRSFTRRASDSDISHESTQTV